MITKSKFSLVPLPENGRAIANSCSDICMQNSILSSINEESSLVMKGNPFTLPI